MIRPRRRFRRLRNAAGLTVAVGTVAGLALYLAALRALGMLEAGYEIEHQGGAR